MVAQGEPAVPQVDEFAPDASLTYTVDCASTMKGNNAMKNTRTMLFLSKGLVCLIS